MKRNTAFFLLFFTLYAIFPNGASMELEEAGKTGAMMLLKKDVVSMEKEGWSKRGIILSWA